MGRNHIDLYWPSFAGLDLIITAVCVIGTFDNWKERIFPFFSKVIDKPSNLVEVNSRTEQINTIKVQQSPSYETNVQNAINK